MTNSILLSDFNEKFGTELKNEGLYIKEYR
jgi:hypothetical protein